MKGIFTRVNTCLSRELVRSGEIPRYFDFLKSLGIGFVRWLEPKPCGAWLNQKESPVLNREEWSTVRDFFIKANSSPEFRDHPVISFEAFTELPENLGCIMGGNSLLYINSAGEVQPCVFFPVTFGNILKEDFVVILERMRKAIPAPIRTGCPAISLNKELKGESDLRISYPVTIAADI